MTLIVVFLVYRVKRGDNKINIGSDYDLGIDMVLISTDDKILIKSGAARGLHFYYADADGYIIVENAS